MALKRKQIKAIHAKKLKFASPKFQRKELLEKSLIHWESELEKSKKQVDFNTKTIKEFKKEIKELSS